MSSVAYEAKARPANWTPSAPFANERVVRFGESRKAGRLCRRQHAAASKDSVEVGDVKAGDSELVDVRPRKRHGIARLDS